MPLDNALIAKCFIHDVELNPAVAGWPLGNIDFFMYFNRLIQTKLFHHEKKEHYPPPLNRLVHQ